MAKWYVVWEGKERGIFESWEKCKLSVLGFSGAKYKSFESPEEAQKAFVGSADEYYQTSQKKLNWKTGDFPFVKNSIAVDAACSGNPGVMEYRGVDLETGEEIFRKRFLSGTNNIGEFLAIVHALSYLEQKGSDKSLYSDSKIAINWVKHGLCKTTMKKELKDQELWDTVARAEEWLNLHGVQYELLKWKTSEWGEIPADFGRK